MSVYLRIPAKQKRTGLSVFPRQRWHRSPLHTVFFLSPLKGAVLSWLLHTKGIKPQNETWNFHPSLK